MGVDAYWPVNTVIDGTRVKDLPEHGFSIHFRKSLDDARTLLRNIAAKNCGLHGLSVFNCNGLTVVSSRFHANGIGVDIEVSHLDDWAKHVCLVECTIEDNASVGVVIQNPGSREVTLERCRIVNNGAATGVHVRGHAGPAWIHNSTIHQPASEAAIRVGRVLPNAEKDRVHNVIVSHCSLSAEIATKNTALPRESISLGEGRSLVEFANGVTG